MQKVFQPFKRTRFMLASEYRSHPCEFVEVPNIHVLIQKNLGGGAFFFRCFLVRGMSKASEKPWFEDLDW